MSQVYVGNPTTQHRELYYRVPQSKTHRVLRIPAAGQAVMPEDLDGEALRSVIAQIEAVGGVPEGDIRAIVMPKAFVYRVDKKPIDLDSIEEGLARDEDARQELAAQKMEESGLAAFKTAENLARPAGAKVIETSVEIVQTNDRGRVKDGVNTEFVVSAKPERRAGRKREEAKN